MLNFLDHLDLIGVFRGCLLPLLSCIKESWSLLSIEAAQSRSRLECCLIIRVDIFCLLQRNYEILSLNLLDVTACRAGRLWSFLNCREESWSGKLGLGYWDLRRTLLTLLLKNVCIGGSKVWNKGCFSKFFILAVLSSAWFMRPVIWCSVANNICSIGFIL